MPATILEVFVDGNLLRYATGHHLNNSPRSVAALTSSCKVLWDLQRLPVCMASLPQTNLKFWPLFMKTHYSLHGLCVTRRGVTDEEVVRIVKCPALHTLDVSGDYDLHGRVTHLAGLGQCASLHTLGLSYCSRVTDVAGLGQ